MRQVAIAAILGVALAGCTTTKEIPIMFKQEKATLPAECRSGSEPWNALPDNDVSKKEMAKLWIDNRESYNGLRYRHGVCRKFARQQAKPIKKLEPKKKSTGVLSWFGI